MAAVTTTDLETGCVKSDFHYGTTSTAKLIFDVVSEVLWFIFGSSSVLLMCVIWSDDLPLIVLAC